MNNQQLDRYAFLWTEARLVIGAIALFIGGVPPALRFFGWFPLISVLLTLCWIVSGVVSAYLLYRWYEHGWHLFGKRDQKDTAAFAVNILTGFNLGVAGLLGTNIGMTISSGYAAFVITGAVYLVTAVYLWRRWSSHGEKLF
jgi:hypothetical protein